MRSVSRATTDLFNRILFQKGRVTLLHLMAFFAVAFSYLANHSGHFSIASCRRLCGAPVIVGSLIAWWPVAVSWWIVKHPMETPAAFRWWQGLFALINYVAAFGYAVTDAATLPVTRTALWSLLHFALLMAIVPLAVESRTGVIHDLGSKPPDKSLERTSGE